MLALRHNYDVNIGSEVFSPLQLPRSRVNVFTFILRGKYSLTVVIIVFANSAIC